MTASLRAAAHCQDAPALAEVGGSGTPGGAKPSLPTTLPECLERNWPREVDPLLVLLELSGTPPPQQVQEP